MTLMYKIFSSESEGAGATVIFSDGTIQQISQDNANYGRVVQTLTSTPVDAIDETALLELLIPALGVGKNLNRLSERVAFDGANILFDGDVVSDAIAEHILRIVKEGGNPDSYKALVAFMEKLYTNPSESSRNSLYDFIVRHNITIDPDGDFYAYKGVKADCGSVWEGFGIVDGVSMNGSLPNKPGSILEIPRSKVNADNAIGCGTGLHAGTYAYAEGWARGVLLLVKINPRDVVSVPTCSAYQKLRTCRYKVISKTTQQTTATTYTAKVGTDLHSINKVATLTKAGEKVPVTFTYTRGNGETILVDMVVTEIRKNNKGESIVIGEDINGESRSYRATYISGLVIDDASLLKVCINPRDVVSVPAPAKAPAKATGDIDALRAGIDKGEIVTCNFNYVKVNGEARTVQNFEANAIRPGGWRGHDLLVGEREDGETRTYRLDRVTDLVVLDAENEDTTASVDITSIAAAVVAPEETLESLLVDGEEVVCDFTYTKKSGEIRYVRNFVANEIRGNNRKLVVGVREDGKTRYYRLDRMTDVEIHDKEATVTAPVALPVAGQNIPKHLRTHLGISVDKLKDIIVNGGTVFIDFKYTTVTGESRTVKNFTADGIFRDLLVGTREEDGETRRYRLANITNIVMHGGK
jgi:hypothetical protein